MKTQITNWTPDFKPCPFCGGKDLQIQPCDHVDLGFVDFVDCCNCHGSAPVNIWNQRSPMAEVKEIMESVKK